jgi:hypothetical protein
MTIMPLAVFAQSASYNPYLIQGTASPAPMTPAEFHGTGTLTFDVGNTGSSDIILVTGQEMLVTVSLSYGVPNVANPNDPLQAITAVSGPGAAWFNWEYFPAQRTLRGTQKATIPGGSRETINIAYKVMENSLPDESYKNGFNANISPPGYTNPQPTNDDTVASYTYVQAFDHGDAPASYDAVAHEINLLKVLGLYQAYMYLGTAVDPEPAYQASATANGDDINQTGGPVLANENGVAFPPMIPGTTVDVPVTITLWDWDTENPLSTATLRGWIDWNRNNDYNNSAAPTGERIISLDVSTYPADLEEPAWTGPKTFTILVPVAVPANASGTYNARFRFGPTVTPILAMAGHGEVEDYQFQAGANLGTVSGHLYLDTNGNATQDGGEPNLPNVTINITNSNNDLQTVATDSNGNWTAIVPAGSTSVKIDESDPQYPTGFAQTQGDDPTVVLAVSGSSINGGIDGFSPGGTISGITQVDTNLDDVGDFTINHITLSLTPLL